MSGPSTGAPDHPCPVSSVYVHAPFCARRCLYCDFAVHVRARADHRPWAATVASELELVEREGRFPLADRLKTVYVGGGTPSILGPASMEALGSALGMDRVRAPGVEWTAEANPESFDDAVAAGWLAAGVNRVSLGVQTFHEPALRWMGRIHGPEGAYRAVERARRAGLDELSLDLIFGLPGEPGRSWSEDLGRVVDLGVPHVSLYGLTVETGTPLGRAVAAGRTSVADEERYRDEYLEAVETLTGAGLGHYEVSNFAMPGHESRHNQAYWSGEAYLGLGNSAHGYTHPLRRWNLRDWDAYQTAVRSGRLPVEGEEVLDEAAYRLERLWLSLRTSRGVDADDLGGRPREVVDSWVVRGLATATGSVVRLTAEGWLVMDRLTVELDAALGRAAKSSDFRPGAVEQRAARAGVALDVVSDGNRLSR